MKKETIKQAVARPDKRSGQATALFIYFVHCTDIRQTLYTSAVNFNREAAIRVAAWFDAGLLRAAVWISVCFRPRI